MHLDALTRLRLAFLALGVVVLGPLAWLLSSVEARLDAQRRLRHEVVAERIFDELERELTSVLGQGSLQARLPLGQRPPVESWPPFVIGYIQRASNGNQLFTRNASGPSDVARLRLAVDGMLKKVGPVAAPALPAGALGQGARRVDGELPAGATGSETASASPAGPARPAAARAVSPAPKLRADQPSQADVLKQLNRANEQRQGSGYR